MPVLCLGPLASWSCFPTFPWVPLAASHKVHPPAWPSQEPPYLSKLEPEGPPWVSLVLSPCGCLLRSSLLSDCSKNHVIWTDSIRTFPVCLQWNSPWLPILEWVMHIIYCTFYSIFCISNCFNFPHITGVTVCTVSVPNIASVRDSTMHQNKRIFSACWYGYF
jgi:hypothetical protein